MTSLRSFELLHSSSFPGPTVLPLPTTGKDPSTPIRRSLRVSGTSEPGGYRGTAVVGRKPSGLEWESSSSSRPQHDNREQCLEGRLGCQLQWGEHGWPMGSIRTVSPHKLPGAAGRLLCNQMLCKRKNKHSRSAFDGQCDSSYVYQQHGSNQI